MKFLEKIFSIKNKYCHKVVTILGLKIKFKNKFKVLEYKISALEKENINLQNELSLTKKNLETTNDKQEKLSVEKNDIQKRLQTQEARNLSIS